MISLHFFNLPRADYARVSRAIGGVTRQKVISIVRGKYSNEGYRQGRQLRFEV